MHINLKQSKNLQELKKLSEQYGFHVGAEGGHYDSLVVDGPIFTKRLEIIESEALMEDEYCGYLHITKSVVVEKNPLLKNVY